ncbi:MAG: tetratricopeptide repeat protein [Gemmatimonadota bacterium]
MRERQFLSSEEYDERAHRLYNEGDYDGALEILKEGLSLYPNAVELSVGLGYARLAREEYAWARAGFSRALVLDPAHEDALVGMGETLLRFGHTDEALALFREVETLGFAEDAELMLTVGRALYREGLHPEARDIFSRISAAHPESPEASASLGYALHRTGDEMGAARQLRRALKLDPQLHEARIYLGHLLYDRGDWSGALMELERVAPQEHWDPLAVWRLMELKRVVHHLDVDDPDLLPWHDRLQELEGLDDPIERLLAEVEATFLGSDNRILDRNQLELFEGSGSDDGAVHQVRLPDGNRLRGSWEGIVRQMRDRAGFSHESLTAYMRRVAEGWHERAGSEVSFHDPESFLRGAVAAGFLILEDDWIQ